LTDFNVTLGTTFPSAVKVFNYGLTVAVCNEGWTDKEARVVCRSQGYASGVAFGGRYSYNPPPRILSFTCNGTETSLNDCAVTTDVSPNCGQAHKGANVYCYNDNTGTLTLPNFFLGALII